MSKEDKIIILDFGSQYTQLIARRVREVGVFSVVLPSDVSIEKIQSFKNISTAISFATFNRYLGKIGVAL